MDVDRLTIEERNQLMKEGRCFKCRNTGHRANECPEEENDKKKGKEVSKKKMNRRELHAHVRALFKEMTTEDRDEFLKGAEEAGFLKRRAFSTSVSPYLDVYSVTIANISRNSISVPINIGSSKQTVKTLIDSGAGGLFIDQNFAKNFDINYLDKPVKAYNMDGTENK
jgi:Zinc knuckle